MYNLLFILFIIKLYARINILIKDFIDPLQMDQYIWETYFL